MYKEKYKVIHRLCRLCQKAKLSKESCAKREILYNREPSLFGSFQICLKKLDLFNFWQCQEIWGTRQAGGLQQGLWAEDEQAPHRNPGGYLTPPMSSPRAVTP